MIRPGDVSPDPRPREPLTDDEAALALERDIDTMSFAEVVALIERCDLALHRLSVRQLCFVLIHGHAWPGRTVLLRTAFRSHGSILHHVELLSMVDPIVVTRDPQIDICVASGVERATVYELAELTTEGLDRLLGWLEDCVLSTPAPQFMALLERLLPLYLDRHRPPAVSTPPRWCKDVSQMLILFHQIHEYDGTLCPIPAAVASAALMAPHPELRAFAMVKLLPLVADLESESIGGDG